MSARSKGAAGVLGRLDELVLAERTAVGLLDVIVGIAAVALDGIADVSVTLRRSDRETYETAHASSTRAAELDAAQYESDLGPCLEAIRTGSEVGSVLPAPAWPDFSARAAEAGVRRVWSLPLEVRGSTTGSMNAYSSSYEGADSATMEVGRVLAAHAATVLANAVYLAETRVEIDHLSRALETRTIIGQAQGLLMAQQRIGADAAFDMLRRASQRSNRKLRDIAAGMVAVATQRGEGGEGDAR